MLVKVFAAAVQGITASIITIEVNVAKGLFDVLPNVRSDLN